MKKTYNVVSKATKLNKLTGEELPQEMFCGPYTIAGHDKDNFYVARVNVGNFYPDVEGCETLAPQVTGFSKDLYKVTEY